MKRPTLACLVTGVPRGFERCAAGLRFLLDEYEVRYFAVLREEFADAATLQCLERTLPGIVPVVVPQAASDAAVAAAPAILAPSLVRMWHELAFAAHAIAGLDRYALVLRTRFDLFFQRQYLPPVDARPDTVWIPDQLNWSGSNDMLCLAPPPAFSRYAATYGQLARIAAEGVVAPEGLLQRALLLQGLAEESLAVHFILYREALFATLSDAQLQALSHIHPALSAYKLGAPGDSDARRGAETALADALTRQEASMPVFAPPHAGQQFGEPEVDARDGSVFRWLAMHAQVRRALAADTRELRFLLHYHVAGWRIEHLRVAIDGNPVALRVSGRDAFGRLQVAGSIERLRPYRRPWSRIGFCSAWSEVPSETGANPLDHRQLSVAVGALAFIGDGHAG